MKKTAVIYDKWLDSMGGGEVVACNLAKILLDNNYDVTIICRKIIPIDVIKQKFNIDISGVNYVEIWNDEAKIQNLSKDKDLFVNISFIDYSIGLAKRNLYYTHFPTPAFVDPKSYIFNEILLPFLSKNINQLEFINPPQIATTINNKLSYQLGNNTTIAFSYLDTTKSYKLKFFIFHESISKHNLENTFFDVSDSTITDKSITLDHKHNVLRYLITFTPMSSTVHFIFTNNNSSKNNTYLIEPHLSSSNYFNNIFRYIENRLNNRLRAGVFTNVKNRISKYDTIIVHSNYVAEWVNKYWNRQSIVLYPPVEMIFDKNKINFSKKKNIICSVGRFFTLGHSKRQDIMINAFKALYDLGFKNWQLCLAGGLGNEPSSIKYMEKLKNMAKGYPIDFIINQPRQEIEKLYLKSKIYWHATGYGQNKNKKPINFEHFGITPVEAMSAGCIPILFNGGGLPEIIDKLNLHTDTHLFNTIDQLTTNTCKIIGNINQYKLSSIDYKQLQNLFGHQTFIKKFEKLIKTTN